MAISLFGIFTSSPTGLRSLQTKYWVSGAPRPAQFCTIEGQVHRTEVTVVTKNNLRFGKLQLSFQTRHNAASSSSIWRFRIQSGGSRYAPSRANNGPVGRSRHGGNPGASHRRDSLGGHREDRREAL